jgi:signal transduction histidine kinase
MAQYIPNSAWKVSMTNMPENKPPAHVLVVDDDEIMRCAAHESLMEAGFVVSEAENGVLAMQSLKNERPDIILLDVMMPEMDGFATAEAIRRVAGCEMLPILMMTALDDLKSINRAYEAGATDFITKPINWVILVERIRYMTRYVRSMNAQKQLQKELQQAQKLEAVATLAGGVAHDFNNLLHVILGSAELHRLKFEKGQPALDELEDIVKAVERGGRLVRQLLTYSREIKSEKRIIRLNDQIEQTNQLLERTIPKMIAIDCRLQKDLRWVNADEVQIEQVLMNLAINAKDAMPNGGRLVIESANVDHPEKHGLPSSARGPRHWIRLSVSDTGHGMDNNIQKHAFDPFYSTKAPGKGTGLGLSMVHGIVQNHDGRIACHSVPGKGTDFHIYLPAVQKLPERISPPEKKTWQEGHEIILLVDDDDITLKTVTKRLEKAGYTVLTASDGEKALEVYQQKTEAIDLILLDLLMPGMGGERCLEALRRINPDIKIIISSGHYPEDPNMRTIERCARACLHKPYPTDQLLYTIRQVVDEERAEVTPVRPDATRDPQVRTPNVA